jgi:transposase, IS5 family
MRHRPSATDGVQEVSPELFRSQLDGMIDLRHPLARLARHMLWEAIVRAFARIEPPDAKGAGRIALPVRLMAGLLYLKHANNLSDEQTCRGWLENPYWQFFTGEVYFQTRLPCDGSSFTRWRKRLGEEGLEELLAQTIEAAKALQAVSSRELECVIVDTTVQEKAVAFPTGSRLLEIARRKLVLVARREGLVLRQSYEREGPQLRRRAGRHAHARQFKLMRGVLRRQRTVLGRLMRDIERKIHSLGDATRERIGLWLQRAGRIHAQLPKDGKKLYALHAPEVACIGKGKARQPYEFGVKVGIAVTARQGLIVGARSFPGNPYDGDTLAEQIEQVENLVGRRPTTVIVDLGYRGREIDGVSVFHRGKPKRLTRRQWQWVKRRQAVEPVIGHLKDDCGMRRCRLKGATGDAVHAVACAAGYNIRWLLRWLAFCWHQIWRQVETLFPAAGTEVRMATT